MYSSLGIQFDGYNCFHPLGQKVASFLSVYLRQITNLSASVPNSSYKLLSNIAFFCTGKYHPAV